MKSKEFRIGKDVPGSKVDRGYGLEDKYKVYKKGGRVTKRKKTRSSGVATHGFGKEIR